jgi:hypothetical protein
MVAPILRRVQVTTYLAMPTIFTSCRLASVFQRAPIVAELRHRHGKP